MDNDRQAKAIAYHLSLAGKPAPQEPSRECLSEGEIASLEATQTESERFDVCQNIRGVRDDEYPRDWFAKVQMSGLAARASARWR